MPILGRCGQCGKSLDAGKKTCGASFAICKKCKMPLHPHCMGEHRLMHNRLDIMAKEASGEGRKNSKLEKVLAPIRKFLSI